MNRRAFLPIALAAFALLPGRAPAANFTMPIVNQTGLDPDKYVIYVMGFSYANNLVLKSNGTLGTQTSGAVKSYKVGSGSGEIGKITIPASTTFVGGRFYFFVSSAGAGAPTVSFGNQPSNPPSQDYPPFAIVEMTIPAPNQNATLDVQTVDGFTVPLTITRNNQANKAGQQYGQPLYDNGKKAVVNRQDIFNAYTQFMNNQGSAGTPYKNLTFKNNGISGQPGGILNPGAYLTATDSTNAYKYLSSSLNNVFTSDLNTLFNTATLRLQGVASTDNSIPVDFYNATVVAQPYASTGVTLPALKFTGVNNAGNVFYIFNPVGIAILTNTSGQPITGTISGNKLTLGSAVSGLATGMYVSGAGLSPAAGLSTTTIAGIAGNVITLSGSYGNPAPNSQYSFSKLPQLVMFQTPGQMVFANSGVFADSTVQFAANSPQATVLGNLENQLVSALNRGVALESLNPGSNGATSAHWGNQKNWYPSGQTQNLFSLFMHTGTLGGDTIFTLPSGAGSWKNARGQLMAAAYGFAYDENGGPVPPAPSGQPEVPSKFDQNIAPGNTVQITLAPWTADATLKPKVKVNGNKTKKTSAPSIKIKGSIVGTELSVKYTNKNGKTVTKNVKVNSKGDWTFKFTLQKASTKLNFKAENYTGGKSSVVKVTVKKQ